MILNIENELNDVTIENNKYNENLNSLLQEKEVLQKKKINLNDNLDLKDKELNNKRNLKDQILKIQIGNKQEFQDLLDESNKQLLILQENQQKVNLKWEETNNYVGTIKHCQQLLVKDFRTYLLKNSILYLNNILENYSKALFSNEKDLIQISNDDTKLDINLGDASYESLSGGEKTRVNIALLLAQKSLANVIGNINCNLIILDEVLGYCDSSAEMNVVNLITTELNSLESIYMISHKEIPIGYDNELIIIKDKNGLSRIREY